MFIEAIAVLMTGGAAYYARQKALPEMRQRAICKSLGSLVSTLEGIGHTGQEIGEHLDGLFVFERDRDRFASLNRLLQIQQQNLDRARTEFEFLGDMFEIQMPEVSDLVIHLTGKRNRIEIIYDASTDLEAKLPERAQPWEVSEVVENPGTMRALLANGEQGIEVRQLDSEFWDRDPDFAKILDALPGLRSFAKENCPMQYLM